MKKSTLIALLVLMVAAAFLLSSCTTVAQKPAPEKQAPAAAQPAPEQPAAAPEQPAPAPAPAPAPEAPAPQAAAPAEKPAALAVWQATGVTVTRGGEPVDLPPEFTSYPVIVRVLDDTNAELVVGDVGFSIPATYVLTGDSLTISPEDYRNPPQVLIDTLGAMGIDQLPAEYYFTISQAADGSGVLEADAMGYHMIATWTQVQ
jgi:hypothetical protein